jgi:hypothetical protein
MISYFDSKNPTVPSIDEISNYVDMTHDYKQAPYFQEITKDINNLSLSNFDEFLTKHESKLTQNRLLPLEFETLVKLKDIVTSKEHYHQETVDETIKQKAHIFKSLHSYAQEAANFGINGFVMRRKFESNGFDIGKDKEIKKFSKNDIDLFAYDKGNKKVYTEGTDIRDGAGTIRIEFRNGNLNVREDLNTIEYHLNERPSRKIKP